MFDLTFSHFLRVLFYMMLIWKDQGKNKRKSNGSSTSRLPFEEFNEEDDVDFDQNNDNIPCSWAKFGQNLQLSIQNVQLSDADHKSGWYGTAG